MPALAAAVSIIFTGLTILDVRNVAQKKVDVLVLQRPVAAPSDYYDNAVIPKHVAFVRFDCGDVIDGDCASTDPTRRNPDFIFTRQKSDASGVQKSVTYGVIVLDRDDVDFDLGSQTATPIQATLISKSGKAEVPSLSALCRRCGPMLGREMPAVGGIVHVTTGSLTVPDAADDGAEWCVRDDLRVHSAKCRKTLPQEVLLDVGVAHPKITLTFSDMDNADVRSLPLDKKGVGSIEIMIGSVPLDDLLNLGNIHERSDHHFEIYYDMMNGKVPAHPPIPHLVRPAAHAHVASNIEPLFVMGGNCPPVKP
jgi:hypothetical protein